MVMRTWDIETTTFTSFKRKANPFDSRNWVVTMATKDRGQPAVETRFSGARGDLTRPGPGWLRPVLDGCTLLVGMNLKFDLLHALQDAENLELWMAWVEAGGRIWDIQLAEYLLNGMTQADHMLSLDEIAPRYGGEIKIDEVKALWAAGVQTNEIEPQLLSRYLCGGEDEHGVWHEGDVGNTEIVALAQIARAREANQLMSCLLNMDAMVFTIEAERNGMFVDKPLALELATKLEERLAELKDALTESLPMLPFRFNWNSARQKSALLFGGTVQYDSYEYQQKDGTYANEPGLPTQAYAQMDVVCVKPLVTADHPVLAHDLGDGWVPLEIAKQADVPVLRFAGGKNAGEIKTKKLKQDDRSKPKGRSCKQEWLFPRMTEPRASWESESQPGVYSTSAEIITELGDRGIPFLKTLRDYTTLTKDLGTYFIVTDERGESKGMLTMVGPDGIIHHKLNMTSTVTGRLSASDPNLQNVPKGNKSEVKLTLKSRFGKDGKVIQSDFSSLEVYLQAILTRCEMLIADLKQKVDMHVMRLSARTGRPYEELLRLCKGYTDAAGVWHEPVKEWDYLRTGAKVFSFQRAYGAGVPKIAASTGMSEAEVQALVDAENERYPEIEAYYASLTDQIKRNRKPLGRVIPHPEVRGVMCHIGQSHVRAPDGKLYTYTESPSPKYLVDRGIFASFSPTEIKNYIVQGEGGEWAKAAMALAVREFYRVRNFGGKALLVNQVHDAVYADADASVALDAAALLHACMECASDYMEHTFNWTLPLPVPTDTTWGESLMDEDSIPDVRQRSVPYRDGIRARYFNGKLPSWEGTTE